MSIARAGIFIVTCVVTALGSQFVTTALIADTTNNINLMCAIAVAPTQSCITHNTILAGSKTLGHVVHLNIASFH